MSGFILTAFAVFFTVLIGLGVSLRMARRRIEIKLTSLEAALKTEPQDE